MRKFKFFAHNKTTNISNRDMPNIVGKKGEFHENSWVRSTHRFRALMDKKNTSKNFFLQIILLFVLIIQPLG